MKIKPFTLVMIIWEDAWASTSDDGDSLIHQTVGFLFRETTKRIVLVQNYYSNVGEKITNNYFSIPKGCITKIHLLTIRAKK